MNHPCDDFRNRLSAYLDGELAEGSAREVERHVDGCPSCRAALDELRLTDRLLHKELTGERIGAESVERSLSDTLERIRREPRASWEARMPKRPHGSSMRWNWRLRWAAGVAVATAAVLLALRLAPLPVAPEKPKGLPHGQAKGTIEKKTPSFAMEKSTEAENELAKAEAEALESAPPVAAQPIAPGAVREKTAEEPQGPFEEKGSTMAGADPKPEGTREMIPFEPTKLEPRIRGGRSDLPTSDAPREVTMMATEKSETVRESASRREMAAETWGNAHSTPRGKDGAREQGIRESDTLASTTGWPERLEAEERHLRAVPEEDLDRSERARRWRGIGDLWEWIGRRDDSPAAFARALEAYRMAIASDPAADLDSTRVQRARIRSAEAIEGNIPPPER